MTVNYRGFEIRVKREKCMAGYALVYYSICRISDGWMMTDSFSETSDSVRAMIKMLKDNVDDYHEHPEDYKEKK